MSRNLYVLNRNSKPVIARALTEYERRELVYGRHRKSRALAVILGVAIYAAIMLVVS